jgi:hypothetical protein
MWCVGCAETARAQSVSVNAVTESLSTDSRPVAILPMRLNGDALSDLAVLKEGTSAPAIVSTTPAAGGVVLLRLLHAESRRGVP